MKLKDFKIYGWINSCLSSTLTLQRRWVFILVLVLLCSKISYQWTSMAEYPLAGLVSTTTSIQSSIDTANQPILKFPSNLTIFDFINLILFRRCSLTCCWTWSGNNKRRSFDNPSEVCNTKWHLESKFDNLNRV